MINRLNSKIMHPALQIVMIIRHLYSRGLVTTSGGNISICDDSGNIWITPSAIDKGSLTVADIVCVTPQGEIRGVHSPSSEFGFHKKIYDLRPQIRSIIHAHPPALVSFSVAHEVPNTNIISQAKRLCGTPGIVAYAPQGSDQQREGITTEFRNHPDRMCVLLENHGVVVCGADIVDAHQRFETFEFCARTILYSRLIGQPNYLTDDQIIQREASVPDIYSFFMGAKYPSDEREIRQKISDTVLRACHQGLMSCSYGTVSVRWQGDDFLITPSGIPRWDMIPEDIVQVKNGMSEAGKLPSRSLALHREIYQNNPNINSIILTQSAGLMAFSVSGNELNLSSMPESLIQLREIKTLPFHLDYGNIDDILEALKVAHCVMLGNDSTIITGDDLMQTFDRLEVAENSARSLLFSSLLGAKASV